MRRSLRWIGAAIVVVAGAGQRFAQADLTGEAAGTVSEGVTNNALLAPDGSTARVSDEFTDVRALLSGTYRGPRQTQTFSYAYAAAFYLEHSDANHQSHALSWALEATPSGRTEIHARVDGTYSTLNSLNPIASTEALDSQVVGTTNFNGLPFGSATFLDAHASALGLFRPTQTLRWQETTSVNEIVPIDGALARTLTVTQDFRHEHEWARNAFTLDLSLEYLRADPFTATVATVPPTVVTEPAAETVEGELLAGWRRNFSPVFLASVELGLLALDSISGNATYVGPAGRATAHYQSLSARALAELVLAHTPQPNVYTGQAILDDSATLRATLPIDRAERFRFVALGSAQHASVIASGGLETAFDLLEASVGLAYQPLTHPFFASLDYNVMDQVGYPGASPGSYSYPSLHMQNVMLSFTVTLGSQNTFGRNAPVKATASVH